MNTENDSRRQISERILVVVDGMTAHRLKPASGLVKPKVRAGDHLLDTSHCEGILATEVPELKAFLKEVIPYRDIDELMPGITRAKREGGFHKVGMDMSVERDAFELFMHIFTNLDPKVDIVDVHSPIMELRTLKDASEIERIPRAAQTTDKGLMPRTTPRSLKGETPAEDLKWQHILTAEFG